MFRQLLAQQQLQFDQLHYNDLFFPNLNQLIKVQPACAQKNISFITLMKMNPKNFHIQFFLDILQEFKYEKIKFITKIQFSQEDKSYIQLSQTPVHVNNGCNYFLLNAFWVMEKGQYLTATKPFNGKQTSTDAKNSSKTKNPTVSSKQIFFNICYMISSTIYIPAENLTDFLLNIKQDNKYFYRHLNNLKVIKLLNSVKKQQGRVSTTAADTKAYHHDTIQSDIFEQDFSFFDKSKSSRVGNFGHRNYFSSHKKDGFYTQTIDRQNKYFSRTSFIQINQTKLMQTILKQICSISQPSNESYFVYQSIQNMFQILQQRHKLITLPQLHVFNSSIITQQILQTIKKNYENSIQQQFHEIDQRSIDQIKIILKQLFDKSLIQFYQKFKNFLNLQNEKQVLDKLLQFIFSSQKILFQNLNKGKRQSFTRRLSFYDDQHYMEKTFQQKQTKFDALLGQRITMEQSIGFGLYRQTIKDKISDIFGDLVGQNQKKSAFKSKKGKLMSRNQLSTNMDRRIQILLSQKRNLQQSLLYEQKLKQNLVQYLNGQHSVQKKRDIETISQYSQDAD